MKNKTAWTLIIGWGAVNVTASAMVIVNKHIQENRRYKRVEKLLEKKYAFVKEADATIYAMKELLKNLEEAKYEGNDDDIAKAKQMLNDFEFAKITFLIKGKP